jgi:hypothetical protein
MGCSAIGNNNEKYSNQLYIFTVTCTLGLHARGKKNKNTGHVA